MPEHCQEIGANLQLTNGQWIFQIGSAGPWLCSLLYACIFVPPIVYLVLNRNRPSVQTRSPKIVIAGLVLMMFDCILNTFLMTQSPHQTSPWAFSCDLGIFVIVVCFFGVYVCLRSAHVARQKGFRTVLDLPRVLNENLRQ
jgi:hypothetical protein